MVRGGWIVLFVLTLFSLPASILARGDTLANYRNYPVTFVIPIAVLLSLIGIVLFCRKGEDRKAFASSCIYLSAMLARQLAFILVCCHRSQS